MAISVAHTDEDKAELLFDAMVSWGVVKCSTPEDEQAKLDPVVTKACIRNCVTKELEIIPNVPILLLGEKLKNLRNIAREIDQGLATCLIQAGHGTIMKMPRRNCKIIYELRHVNLSSVTATETHSLAKVGITNPEKVWKRFGMSLPIGMFPKVENYHKYTRVILINIAKYELSTYKKPQENIQVRRK
jgi:hypothetical protein